MKTIQKIIFLYGIFLLSIISSCKKQDDFLDAKPNEALAIPTSLSDLQSLLHDEDLFNRSDPGLGEISGDDYYVLPTDLASQTPTEQNGYIWAKTVYAAGADVPDWSQTYQQVYYANTVLDYLPKITYPSSQQAIANQIKSEALFFRSIAFYNLLQTFTLPYDPKTSGTDLGIPLRLSSDLNIKSTRAPVQQCYNQIISDLIASLQSLPVTPAYKTLPSLPAANALLSRVYMAIGDYSNSFKYANACLAENNTLVDYNTLTPVSDYQLSNTYLPEDIFHSMLQQYDLDYPNYVSIADTSLYASYTSNDLRKRIFFVNNGGTTYYFRGTYDINGNSFSGIATDEVYLIRAECNARLGNTTAALNDLNTLLIKRWKTGTFVPYAANSADAALSLILMERRKELLYRGLRWPDLRRLNKDSRFAITLTRNLNGVIYTLPPNDVRYAWPIPDNEIQLSGIPQNAR